MDIICFANDWDGDPLSKKHIMRRLARRGARVLWVNSLGNRAPRLGDAKDRLRAVRKITRFARSAWNGPREVDRNIWVVDPIAAPVYGSRWAARANALFVGAHVRNAVWRLGMRHPVHYSFVPASAWVAGQLGERAFVRHGVEHDRFARALDPATPIPEALRAVAKPVVGFVGLIAEWVDLDLMGKLADHLAATGGGSLALVGDVRGADAAKLAALAARPNVLHAGRRPYAELPGWCRGF